MTDTPLSQEAVLKALSTVQDPELGRDIVSLGMARDVTVDDGRVSVRIVLTTPACPLREEIRADAVRALEALPGVREVDVHMDAEVRQHQAKGPRPVAGVRHVIAVASNKGGVGKSTVAVNLSVALAKRGARVGLLDADMTGPNIPTMFGLEPGFMAEEGLTTVDRFGVRLVSLGFLLTRDTPTIWRGPMLGRAISQLVHEVEWGELDYLIVDLPPGTSDASLSLAQEAALSGVVIVSTPQAVSMEDARKAVTMFQRLEVPILGFVENMSYFVCPHCGEKSEIFGSQTVELLARQLGLPFLAAIPLHAQTREAGDNGVPVVEAAPDSEQSQSFRRVAEAIASRCSVLEYQESERE